jgi:dTDP-4-dehydrorhamnose 3,5-epimerase
MSQRRLNEFSGVSIMKRDTFPSELGSFSVLFDQSINFGEDFYQDSISIIKHPNTIKGMHFQSGHFAQAKLVTILQGGIIDFFVDLRKDSSTFLDYGSVELNSKNNDMLLIPKGFAHGYFSAHEDTIISYKLDAPYSPDHEYTLLWSDPGIGIKWPTTKNTHISSKDRAGLNLPEIENKL